MTAGTPYFEVHLSEASDPVTIAATGELDAASAETLADALAQARARSGQVVLDLAGLTFIDSSGLRVVAAEHVTSGESGSAFRIVGATDRVRRIFEMTGLETLIEG